MLDRKLKLEDLEVGMKIRDKSQLSGIYDMWVILTKAPDESYYTIGFFGKETNEQSDKLFNTGNKICPVYNDSMELEGDVFFEE